MIRTGFLCVTLILLAGLCLSASPAVATTPADGPVGPVNPRPGISLTDLAARQSLEATLALTEDGVMLAQADVNTLEDGRDVYGYEPKSVKRAFLQSFLIPGWGQWYNGSRWKPFVFLGLEAAGWYGWSNFRSNGNDKEDEYRAFADIHWKDTAYWIGLQQNFDFLNPPPEDLRYLDTTSYRVDTSAQGFIVRVFSHHAYFDADGNPVEEDTYYENIGKYDQFQYGWDDYEDGDSTIDMQPHRAEYVSMRDKANKEFNKASTVLILTIGNHLLSAFEAALGAKRYNRALDQFGAIEPELRLTNSQRMDKLSPTLVVRYRF
ncbi:MAG: DUF5683 domain-containing protein [Candidatus Zixiibacteriota bacterium]